MAKELPAPATAYLSATDDEAPKVDDTNVLKRVADEHEMKLTSARQGGLRRCPHSCSQSRARGSINRPRT